MGYAGRGKLFLLAALAAGLCGLVITIVALTLLVEGGVPTLPLRSGARRSSSFRSSSLGSRP